MSRIVVRGGVDGPEQLLFAAEMVVDRALGQAGGNRISWEGIDRMRLRDGLVADSLVAFDTAGRW